MPRTLMLPLLGILGASAALGLTGNALRDHGRIEIGRTYFTSAAVPAGAQPAGGPRADDLAARAAAEFTVLDIERAAALRIVAEASPGRVVFLDSRGDAWFAQDHVPGALQLDYFDLRRRIAPSLPFLRVVPWLVVYCESSDCEDGLLLCRALRDEYDIPTSRLMLFVGGMRQWRERGLPIATGARP